MGQTWPMEGGWGAYRLGDDGEPFAADDGIGGSGFPCVLIPRKSSTISMIRSVLSEHLNDYTMHVYK